MKTGCGKKYRGKNIKIGNYSILGQKRTSGAKMTRKARHKKFLATEPTSRQSTNAKRPHQPRTTTDHEKQAHHTRQATSRCQNPSQFISHIEGHPQRSTQCYGLPAPLPLETTLERTRSSRPRSRSPPRSSERRALPPGPRAPIPCGASPGGGPPGPSGPGGL